MTKFKNKIQDFRIQKIAIFFWDGIFRNYSPFPLDDSQKASKSENLIVPKIEDQLDFMNNLMLCYALIQDTRGPPAPDFSGTEREK